jgi:hypothetical protein
MSQGIDPKGSNGEPFGSPINVIPATQRVRFLYPLGQHPAQLKNRTRIHADTRGFLNAFYMLLFLIRVHPRVSASYFLSPNSGYPPVVLTTDNLPKSAPNFIITAP